MVKISRKMDAKLDDQPGKWGQNAHGNGKLDDQNGMMDELNWA